MILLVKGIESSTLDTTIQTVVSYVSPDQCTVLLLHEAVIILLVGAAATEVQPGNLFSKVADEVVIEEFAAIVWMKLPDGEG